jgi:formyltetrahydrofolate deformylase
MPTFTLTLSCPQRPGIVHAVTSFLFHHGCDIVEHQQFDDATRGLFLRTAFSAPDGAAEDLLAERFAAVADEFGMSFTLVGERTPRVLVMVS